MTFDTQKFGACAALAASMPAGAYAQSEGEFYLKLLSNLAAIATPPTTPSSRACRAAASRRAATPSPASPAQPQTTQTAAWAASTGPSSSAQAWETLAAFRRRRPSTSRRHTPQTSPTAAASASNLGRRSRRRTSRLSIWLDYTDRSKPGREQDHAFPRLRKPIPRAVDYVSVDKITLAFE